MNDTHGCVLFTSQAEIQIWLGLANVHRRERVRDSSPFRFLIPRPSPSANILNHESSRLFILNINNVQLYEIQVWLKRL